MTRTHTTARRSNLLRTLGVTALTISFAGCGAIPFVAEADVVTGTDEAALRAASEDFIDAFVSGDHARVASYVDPTCGVTEDRAAAVHEYVAAIVAWSNEVAVTELTFDEYFSSVRIVGVAVDGGTGIVTTTADWIGDDDTSSSLDDSEWRVVDGRWVQPSCAEFLTFEEAEEFGHPTNVRFDVDGSVIVLDDPGSGDNQVENTIDDASADASADDTTDASTDDAVAAPPAPDVVPVLETASTSIAPDGPPAPEPLPAPAPEPTTASVPASTAAPIPAPPPPTQAPAAPAKLDSSFIVASVSSELPAVSGITYGAGNLFDGTLDNAWNHCGSCTGSSGVGQRITVGFTQPVTLVGIRIANGYQKNEDDVYARNHRVAQMTVSTLEASATQTLTVADATGFQDFQFPRTTTTGLIIDIDAIHPGSHYVDLAISEIEFIVTPA